MPFKRINQDVIEKTSGVAAAGGSSAPTDFYGQFLTTHGFGALSFAEWMQVIGSIYVCFLLLKGTGILGLLCRGINKVYKRLKGFS